MVRPAEIMVASCLVKNTCVLSGTGSVEHLRENLKAAELPALGEDTRKRLEAITGGWDHLAAQ